MEEDRARVDIGIAANIDEEEPQPSEPLLKQPKKRFVGRRTAAEATTSAGAGDAGAIQGEWQLQPFQSTKCLV